MDSTITAKQRDKTIKNFEERQTQILLAKNRSKKSIRKIVAAISDTNFFDAINELKDELTTQYKETYPEDSAMDLSQDSNSGDDYSS